MKKYLLAVDSYTLQGNEGHNSNTYLVKNNDLLPLKEQEGVQYMNLENFVGGGEAFDYDLIEFPEDMNAVFVYQENKNGTNHIRIAFDRDKTNERELEAVLSEKFSIPETKMLVTFDKLEDASTLEDLRETIPENDFAQRELGTEEGINSIKEHFSKKSDRG